MTRCRIAPYPTPTQLQRNSSNILLMNEILPQLIGSFPHNLQGLFHPRWWTPDFFHLSSHLEMRIETWRFRNLPKSRSQITPPFFEAEFCGLIFDCHAVLWVKQIPVVFFSAPSTNRPWFFWTDFSDTFFGELNRWPLIAKETSTPSYCISTWATKRKLLLSIYWLFKGEPYNGYA